VGRVESLFALVRAHAALRFPWLSRVRIRFCPLADAEHRKRWRQFAHTGHESHVVCFARAAQRELTDEEVLGMSAHELGHVVGIRLRYPEHTRAHPRSKGTPKVVQDEADRIAREVLGFSNLRYNLRTLEELSIVRENPMPRIMQKPTPEAIQKSIEQYPYELTKAPSLDLVSVKELVPTEESTPVRRSLVDLMEKSPWNVPPIIIRGTSIVDGHHRYVAAKAVFDYIWALDLDQVRENRYRRTRARV